MYYPEECQSWRKERNPARWNGDFSSDFSGLTFSLDYCIVPIFLF
jgi:hypothetical protein